MAEVKQVIKAETIILENKLLIAEALALFAQSRGRAMSKVKNPVILKELALEFDRIGECRRAINSL